MGFFKSKEEKEAERRERALKAEQFANTIRESPLTRNLQLFLIQQFGDANSEEVQKLRQLAAGGGRAGYIMHVQSDGIVFDLVNRKGESLDKWGISFDALGYQNLPGGGAGVLNGVLLQTLKDIPHLMVLDTGFFMYQFNRQKQAW